MNGKCRRRQESKKVGPSHILAFVPLALICVMSMASPSTQHSGFSGVRAIKHVVVIMQENHSFDNYFGTYPGAKGLDLGVALPLSPGSSGTVHPFLLTKSVVSVDPCHDWRCSHVAFDGGRMDGFVYASKSKTSMGYFDYHTIPYYWDYASRFVLLDNYFSSIMGPTTPNRMYLIAGQSAGLTYNANLLPNKTAYSFHVKTIMDELDQRGVSWKYYTGYPGFYNGFNILPSFTSFRQNPGRLDQVVPRWEFFSDTKSSRLPSVAWVMPQSDRLSEHPPYNVTAGELSVVSVINAVMESKYWQSTAIFLTWDEGGGWYDNVPPPQVDSFGYGFRVPCLIISPYARQGYIDHTVSDHTSILKFIETVFGLPPLTSRDGSASDLLNAFDFEQGPRPPLVLPGPYAPNHYPLALANTSAVLRGESTSVNHAATTNHSAQTSAVAVPGGTVPNRRLLFSLMVIVGSIFVLVYFRQARLTKA